MKVEMCCNCRIELLTQEQYFEQSGLCDDCYKFYEEEMEKNSPCRNCRLKDTNDCGGICDICPGETI